MNNRVYSVTFGGIGGQGILKASEICSWAALFAGYHVKKSEVHGMSQRGGSVESHVRFGKRVYSPLVPLGGADVLVCFHAEEQPRLQAFLKKEGIDLSAYLEEATQAMADNLENAKNAMPTLTQWPRIVDALGEGIASVLLGRAQPKEALDQAAQEADALLVAPA